MYEPAEREFFTVPIEDVLVPEGRVANEAVVKALVESIGRIGLINPLTVVQKEDAFELVAGMNRLEACRELGLTWVWVVVLGEGEPVHEIEFDENLVRVHLTPERLVEHRKWVKAELRRRVGEGESVRKAAKDLGVPESSARRESAGAPSGAPARRVGTDGKSYPPTRPSSEEKSERAKKAKQLREDGKTLEEVASDLGVSRRTAASDLATAFETDSPEVVTASHDVEPPAETSAITVELGAADLIRAICADQDDEPAPSRETFARLIGTTPDVVAAWESGARAPSGPELTLLMILSLPDGLESWIASVVTRSAPFPRDVSMRKFNARVREQVEAVKRGEVRVHLRPRRAS